VRSIQSRRPKTSLACLLAVVATPALAQQTVELETVEVTSARIPVNLRDATVTVSVVTGDDLRARGATDLRTALSLVAGVDIAPGGDSGPAGSVPALWGLREFDAFLLVVDGVPWGGAFTPALATMNLNNVERIANERIGRETVTYVSNIYKYYITYRLLTEEQQRRDAAKAAVRKGSKS